ncbi:hypothetical protein E4T56_gene20017 [Termitomyces sp. T112]|nr:hypothetical protein E4T56_gene20017 [Termitomyces sp. T112]
MQPLPKPIPVYNIDGMPNKAGAINSMVDLVLHYWNHSEHAMFAVTSLGRQDMILGFTWLCEHNPETMMNDIFWDLIAEGVFYFKLEKCKFEQTQIEYLGLIISHGAVEMDLVKVAGVAEWLEPKNKKEVQAFLGFANFYQRFIQDFLHYTHPLFNLMGKDVTWSWGPPEQTAFDTLKCTMTSGPILLFLDDNSPFQVEADSSNFATGAMLSQQSPEDGKWHPVAFYSKSLNVVEQNYKIHDKEMLAIIWSFKEWWHFLEGMQHKFEV